MTNSLIPIIPVADMQTAEKAVKTVGENALHWMQQSKFNAEPFAYCLIPDSDGNIAAVLVGVNPESPIQALAGLPKVLPSADYHLQCELDEHWQQQAHLGWQLGSYRFERYLRPKKNWPRLHGHDSSTTMVDLQVTASNMARDLINTPTEDMGPDHLQQATEQVASQFDAEFSVIIGAELEADFPAIHAVGRGSHRAPRLLRLSWGEKSHPKIALIGKGVCFDTGGLNLKSASGMRKMKKDMGGAAHALALTQLIMASKLPVQLELYLPTVENAVDANAYRPGDVVSTRQGLSVEIGNTDAEGRVILADALTLACEHQPELMIDFATLTGAARVALGTDLPALFSNNAELRQELHICGDEVEDPMWPLPLYQPYMRLIDSDIADLCNNASSSFGGAITAALFLQQFTNKDIPWCHLDTYGWNDSKRPGRPLGGEAMGLRAVFRMLQNRYGG